MRQSPLLLLALLAIGCSGGGKLVKKSAPVDGQQPGQGGTITLPETGGTQGTTGTEVAHAPPTAPVDVRVKFEKGRKETYVITNSTVTETRGWTDGPLVKTESFLNARQEVTVRDANLVRIRTYDVKAGVYGDNIEQKEADAVVKGMARSVEGSLLQGEYDAYGRGTNQFLLGEGVGLNPVGPQAGAQEVMLGFMGILLPGKPAKVGDKWSGTYDITASAQDLFASAGGMVDNGEIPITYELLDYNKETNFVKIGMSSKGKPTIKIPMGGGLAKIEMTVSSKGQALVRYNDGWLQELRVESTIVTEGYVATKQVVKTVTRRAK